MNKLIKIVFVFLLAAMTLTGCNYRITSSGSIMEFNSFRVLNRSTDLTATKRIITQVYSNFHISETFPNELELTVVELEIRDKFSNPGRESVRSSLNLQMEFKVVNPAGLMLYQKTLHESVTFNTGDTASAYTENYREALRVAFEHMIERFTHDFRSPLTYNIES